MNTISTTEARDRLEQEKDEIALFDVRTASEFEEAHIRGARNIPLEEIEARIEEFRTTLPIFLICRSGVRSEHAQFMLAEHDIENTYNVLGGMIDWVQNKFPVE